MAKNRLGRAHQFGSTLWVFVAALAAPVLAGCLGVGGGNAEGGVLPRCLPEISGTVPCPGHEPAAPWPYELRVSNCTEVGHTIRAPPALFEPDYPAGTQADASLETIAYHHALICEQGTDATGTSASVHIAWFGAVINSPGPSAAGADFRLAGFELITNHAGLADVAERAGWQTRLAGDFALEFDSPAGQGAVANPYRMRTPAEEPLHEFSGTINRASASPERTEIAQYFYTRTPESIFLLRLETEKNSAGPSQGAVAFFGSSSYWSERSPIPAMPAINVQDVNSSGFVRLAPIAEY